MQLSGDRTVRDFVLEMPHATRVFEKMGIDYCCGGNKPLENACAGANVKVDDVLKALQDAAATPAPEPERNWKQEKLGLIAEHIARNHHQYTREAIGRLGPLFAKVCSVHGSRHPELAQARDTFSALAQELSTHMAKEEMILFPFITRMELAVDSGAPVMAGPFGSVDRPIAAMMQDHDAAGHDTAAIREATRGYQPPEDACGSYRALYRELAELEADLHQHIHLENNILFPRAIAMERAAAGVE